MAEPIPLAGALEKPGNFELDQRQEVFLKRQRGRLSLDLMIIDAYPEVPSVTFYFIFYTNHSSHIYKPYHSSTTTAPPSFRPSIPSLANASATLFSSLGI